MIKGGPLQQQVSHKVQGEPGEDDQDGQAQPGPEQARNIVGEARARIRAVGKATAQLARRLPPVNARDWFGKGRIVSCEGQG